MIDISEEAQQREALEEQGGSPGVGGAAHDDANDEVDGAEMQKLLARAQTQLEKKAEEYKLLVSEATALRTSFDDYKTKAELEVKNLRRAVAEEKQANEVCVLFFFVVVVMFFLRFFFGQPTCVF